MESTTEFVIDLFSLANPSQAEIDQVSRAISVSGINRSRLTEQLEAAKDSASDMSVGIGYYLLDRFAQAVEKLHTAPVSLEKCLYLARALTRCKRFDEAINAYGMAQEQGADATMIALEKSSTYRQAGMLEEAEAELNKAGGENVSADYHFYKARLCEAQGDHEAAMTEYDTALEINPSHDLALFHMALRCDLNGDEDDAISYYLRIEKAGCSYANAMLNLAVLYEDNEQFERASQCVDAVLVNFPAHPRANLFKKDIESSKTMFFDEEKERRRSRKNQILETPITDFELSVRSRNCLKKMNIRTLGDLLRITEAELLSYKNFGETSLREIKAILDSKGLSLGMALEDKQFARGDIPMPEETADEGMLAKPVDDLQLSVRARKCLQKLNIRTIGDITRTTEAELLGCKNFGVTSLNEINKALSGLGYSLRRLD